MEVKYIHFDCPRPLNSHHRVDLNKRGPCGDFIKRILSVPDASDSDNRDLFFFMYVIPISHEHIITVQTDLSFG